MAVALGVPLLLFLAGLFPAVANWQYGIMMDAGSGGTRLHVFRWPPRQADPLRPLYAAVTQPEEIFASAIKPGISSFANNVTGLQPYLKELLQKAKDALQDLREEWYIIPIYMKATAGARDLFQDQRDSIFATIRATLFESEFRFDSEYWARTISGEEEAVHAWLTVNTILGTFRASQTANTWGALDMGGASTQMVFIPKDVSIIQNYFPLHLSYYKIHLYSHSFLEFGYRDANLRLLRLLNTRQAANGGKADPISNPCMPKGVFFAQPLTSPFAKKGETVMWVNGTGDFAECMALAEELLHTDARCFVPAVSREFAVNTTQKNGACGINGIYEPSLHGRQFIAMGQYSKLAKLLKVPEGTPVMLSDMLPGLVDLCSAVPTFAFAEDIDDPEGLLRLSQVNQAFKDPMSLPFSRCWKALWMFQVLHRGLRFPLNRAQITFANQLNGQDLGWALGAMMHEVNLYPWQTLDSTGFAERPPGGHPLSRGETAEKYTALHLFGAFLLSSLGWGVLLAGARFARPMDQPAESGRGYRLLIPA